MPALPRQGFADAGRGHRARFAEHAWWGFILNFECDDVARAYHELVNRGINATHPTTAFYGMKQTYLTDPDGYELCFQSSI